MAKVVTEREQQAAVSSTAQDAIRPSATGAGPGHAPIGYHDYPVIHGPIWKWEIPVYFWTGGLAGGAYLTSVLARLTGNRNDVEATKDGFSVAALAAMASLPLLIRDLGRPERFHHMLRVFKPSSPMNLGAWVLSVFSPVAMVRAMAEFGEGDDAPWPLRLVARLTPRPLLNLVGASTGLALAGYTGVLLGSTNVPLWARSKLLGGVFTSSAMASGSSAVSLLAERRHPSASTARKLRQFDQVATAAELGSTLAYVATSGPAVKPLNERYAIPFWGGGVGIGMLLPLALHSVSPFLPRGARRTATTVASLASLAGSLATRWSITKAGSDSSKDQQASFELSSEA
jgi:formate-dependent nitrite reductase membrane component NrfD